MVTEGAAPERLARLVEDYLVDCRARGLSPNTLEDYGYILRLTFLPWCREQGLAGADELGQRELNRWTAGLLERGGRRGKPLSRRTVGTYVRTVNLFLGWCHREGEARAVKAQSPRPEQRLLEVLSRDEIDRLEAAAESERDKLIVRALADTGIRTSELLGLRRSDLQASGRERYLRVRGKGSRERLVPVPLPVFRRLEKYARARPGEEQERIFLSRNRAPSGGRRPLTRSGVAQLITNLQRQCGMEKRVYPHLLRHSWATEALRRGMNPIMVARVLGHTSLAMIDRTYSHLSTADMHEAVLRMLAEEAD